MIQLSDKDIARFWSHVDKSGDCWIWTYTQSRGYGYTYVYAVRRAIQSHRVSWIIAYGQIPEGMFVCHKCDNPSCVNPSHLFIGAAANNSRDMVKKGRSARGFRHGAYTHPEKRPHKYGTENGQSKLTDYQVRSIRYLASCRIPQRLIGSLFGINQQTVSKIVARIRWAHLT